MLGYGYCIKVLCKNKKHETGVSFHPGREQIMSLDWELIPAECTDKEHALHAFVSRALGGDVIHGAVTGDLTPLHLLFLGLFTDALCFGQSFLWLHSSETTCHVCITG